MERGKKYTLTLRVLNPTAASLRDGVDVKNVDGVQRDVPGSGIQTNLEGFNAATMGWPHIFGVSFRRRLGESWFRPIARIGEKGTDEYILTPDDGTIVGDKLTSTITARRDGNLYVFVNDAVLPIPKAFSYPLPRKDLELRMLGDLFKSTPSEFIEKFRALFVWNKQMLPVPDSWQWFYNNNRGAIAVDVRPLL